MYPTLKSHLQTIKAEHVEKKTLTAEEERILDRYLLEYKHQGYDLTIPKYEELNANWMKRLNETKSQYNYRMMVITLERSKKGQPRGGGAGGGYLEMGKGKLETGWAPNFLKFRFQMVWYSNGWSMY